MKSLAMVVIFFLFISQACVARHKSCSKCGEMEVPYPLSTKESCGDSNYRVYCNKKALEFKSSGGSFYRILTINPAENKLVISPPEIETGACYSSDLDEGGLKLDEMLPFNISNRNTVMLLNCSDNILLSPLNCSSNSLCRVFEESVQQGSACSNCLCCSFLKDASMTSHRIRVRVGGCTAYTSVVDLQPAASPASWNYGIELQWQPPL